MAFAKDYDYSVNANLECGYYDSRALYATFGYEKQLFMCKSGIVAINVDFKNNWTFKGEFAPIYYSLKNEDSRVNPHNDRPYAEEYTPNGDYIAVDGSTKYVDWYKNMGDRMYNIGEELPFRELYIAYEGGGQTLKIGRFINGLSFSNDEMIWGDNSWFAPMSYFFSKDIYNGFSSTYTNFISLTAEVTGGDGNSVKNHIYYLENEGNGNLKSNNTPTITLNASFDHGMGKIFAGWERGRIGSTYSQTTKEGKHTKEITAMGGDFKYQGLRLFGQYTLFVSGMRKDVYGVVDEEDVFGVIKQKGYFLGVDYTYGKFKFGVAYEEFDRYDFRAKLYSKKMPNEDEASEQASPPFAEKCVGGGCYNGKNALNGEPYTISDLDQNVKQNLYIVNIIYSVNANIDITFSYSHINNPYYFVSNISKEHGEDKMRLVFNLKL
ncbi:MAG: porin [Rickettsiales bacterium]|nr:porin [Rickettsiales bacterium]